MKVRIVKFWVLAATAAGLLFFLTGCASPFMKKGRIALNSGDYQQAYDNFKRVPGSPVTKSKLAEGLSKSTEGLGEEAVDEAAKLFLMAENVRMPLSKNFFNQAISHMDDGIKWYKQAFRNAEIYKKGSGTGIADLICTLEKTRSHYIERRRLIQRRYVLEEARSALNDGRFGESARLFKAVIEFDWSDVPSQKETVRNELMNAYCQTARKKIREQDWQGALSVLEQLDHPDFITLDPTPGQQVWQEYVSGRIVQTLHEIRNENWAVVQEAIDELTQPAISKLNPESIARLKSEYDVAYSELLVRTARQIFESGNIPHACTYLEQASTLGNDKAYRILSLMKTYQEAIEKSLKKAQSEYVLKLSECKDYLSPEAICAIEQLMIEPFSDLSSDKKIKTWLDGQGIGFADIQKVAKGVLTPFYRLTETPDALIKGTYEIRIIEDHQWELLLEVWLEDEQQMLFRNKKSLMTGVFDIYSGWGFLRHIRDDQAPLLRASLDWLTREVLTPFVPFGRCKNKMLLQFASKALPNVLNDRLVKDDLEILRLILKKEIKNRAL